MSTRFKTISMVVPQRQLAIDPPMELAHHLAAHPNKLKCQPHGHRGAHQ